MRNKIITLFLLVFFITSCNRNFFNPRYYYNKTKTAIDDSTDNDVVLPDGIDDANDPFKLAPYNDINYGGYNGNIFDTWLFKVSFQGDKLPIYNFFNDNSRSWIYSKTDWKGNEGSYYKPADGENKVYGTMVGDVGISAMTIYKYDKYNPLYPSIGYLSGRMDRFRFYSIDGKASVSTLQQYLIAVDTYSKFIFAYGAITKVQSILGDLVPVDFKAVEFYGDRVHFYEYDPIGYVTSTGEVVLYEHYKTEFVKSPTTYLPSKHGYETVAEHDPYKPGHSPYIPLVEEEITEDNIIITVKEFKNISVRSAEGYLSWFTPKYDRIKEYGYFTYGIAGAAYDLNTLEMSFIEKLKENGATVFDRPASIAKIDINSSKSFSSKLEFLLKDIDKVSAYIDLGANIRKYNTLTGFVDTDNFGTKGGSGIISSKEKPMVKLKYDTSSKKFVISSSSINSDDNVTISYDSSFTLSRGEQKDFTIRYKWMKGNDQVNGEEVSITYTLEFQSIE